MKKPIIALIYDFDKTLSTKDMQEFTFIPELNMEAAAFWQETNKKAVDNNMDPILAYLHTMLQKATALEKPIRRNDFVDLGKEIEYFPGIIDWFERINQYGEKLGLSIEHYIISSGLKEIIEGSVIAKYFKKIYASEYYYDVNGVAKWPAMAVNYTGKTQFLFRINKGALEVYDDKGVNEFIGYEKRRVSFEDIIYIGDGITDIPCMKLVKEYGGNSIAVYTERNQSIVYQLFQEGRVNYVAKADYNSSEELDNLIQTILEERAVSNKLLSINNKQRKQIGDNDDNTI